MSATPASVRPVAVLAAALLVAGLVPTVPAAADGDEDAPVAIQSRAVYPYERFPGYPGLSPSVPADAGLDPGRVSLSVVVFNRSDLPVRDVSVSARVVTNGRVDSVRCATSPLFADDVRLLDGVLQGPLPPFPSVPSPGATPPSWSDPDLVLAAHTGLYCAVWVSGITDKALNETVASTTGTAEGWGTPATHEAHTWAAAGQRRQGFPHPDRVVALGSAFVDRDEDGLRDVDPDDPAKSEPVVAGARVTITGPDGRAVPLPSGSGVIGPQTTGPDGSYLFRDLRPYTNYSLTLHLDSPSLAGLAKLRDADGRLSADRKTWTQDVRADGNAGGDWRLVPADRVYLTADAPRSVIAGSTVTFTGRAERARSGAAVDGPVVLESRPPEDNSDNWTKVADVTNHDGRLSVSLAAVRTIDYRFRYVGDDAPGGSVCRARRLSVVTAPIAFRISAPATVAQGDPLTVSGTITRAGRPFQSGRLVLQFTPDGDHIVWTTAASVRSTATGTLSATLPAPRSGYYRWRYFGDSRTSAGKSAEVRVLIST